MNTKVFLHLKPKNKKEKPTNVGKNFLRLPIVGEYITTGSVSPWYRVDRVLHCAFDTTYSAEIWAVEIRDPRIQKKAIPTNGNGH